MAQQPLGTPLAVSLRRKLIWIALSFFASCLILIFSFVLNLVELTSNSLMKLEAESIIRQSQQMPNHPLPKSHTLSASFRDSEYLARTAIENIQTLLIAIIFGFRSK